jgi:hypothetical protein
MLKLIVVVTAVVLSGQTYAGCNPFEGTDTVTNCVAPVEKVEDPFTVTPEPLFVASNPNVSRLLTEKERDSIDRDNQRAYDRDMERRDRDIDKSIREQDRRDGK